MMAIAPMMPPTINTPNTFQERRRSLVVESTIDGLVSVISSLVWPELPDCSYFDQRRIINPELSDDKIIRNLRPT